MSAAERMAAPTSARLHDRAWIGGQWVAAGGASGQTLVHDSWTERVVAVVHHGSPAQAVQAAEAAARAQPAWAALPVAERVAYIERIADGLDARAPALAEQITRETGMPLKLSLAIQVKAPVEAWRGYARAARALEWVSNIGHSRIHQVPVGVVACITPWNYPLHQITAKVAPALLAGCTVVLKPSELAPAAAQALAEVVAEADVPAGVFNLVFGDGALGDALVRHPRVQMVSFTGSTTVGTRVAAAAAADMKRLAMELGGKSAALVLPGADLPLAIKRTVAACMLNSGQTCNALTRLLVPRADLDRALALARDAVATLPMGDPMARETRLGPLSSAAHAERVRKMIGRARADGARLVAGGDDVTIPPTGFFVAPTVLEVRPDSEIAQEEVFGPVLCVLPFDTVDEAVAIANGTPYGLAAAVWAPAQGVAETVALRLRAGQVDINGAAFNIAAPFGGFGRSGVGRENGPLGLLEFLEPISLQLPQAPQA